jgi:prophage maintenance system killer protein
MDLHLDGNGDRLTAAPADVDHMFRAVAAREHSEDYFIAWVRSNTERR